MNERKIRPNKSKKVVAASPQAPADKQPESDCEIIKQYLRPSIKGLDENQLDKCVEQLTGYLRYLEKKIPNTFALISDDIEGETIASLPDWRFEYCAQMAVLISPRSASLETIIKSLFDPESKEYWLEFIKAQDSLLTKDILTKGVLINCNWERLVETRNYGLYQRLQGLRDSKLSMQTCIKRKVHIASCILSSIEANPELLNSRNYNTIFQLYCKMACYEGGFFQHDAINRINDFDTLFNSGELSKEVKELNQLDINQQLIENVKQQYAVVLQKIKQHCTGGHFQLQSFVTSILLSKIYLDFNVNLSREKSKQENEVYFYSEITPISLLIIFNVINLGRTVLIANKLTRASIDLGKGSKLSEEPPSYSLVNIEKNIQSAQILLLAYTVITNDAEAAIDWYLISVHSKEKQLHQRMKANLKVLHSKINGILHGILARPGDVEEKAKLMLEIAIKVSEFVVMSNSSTMFYSNCDNVLARFFYEFNYADSSSRAWQDIKEKQLLKFDVSEESILNDYNFKLISDVVSKMKSGDIKLLNARSGYLILSYALGSLSEQLDSGSITSSSIKDDGAVKLVRSVLSVLNKYEISLLEIQQIGNNDCVINSSNFNILDRLFLIANKFIFTDNFPKLICENLKLTKQNAPDKLCSYLLKYQDYISQDALEKIYQHLHLQINFPQKKSARQNSVELKKKIYEPNANIIDRNKYNRMVEAYLRKNSYWLSEKYCDDEGGTIFHIIAEWCDPACGFTKDTGNTFRPLIAVIAAARKILGREKLTQMLLQKNNHNMSCLYYIMCDLEPDEMYKLKDIILSCYAEDNAEENIERKFFNAISNGCAEEVAQILEQNPEVLLKLTITKENCFHLLVRVDKDELIKIANKLINKLSHDQMLDLFSQRNGISGLTPIHYAIDTYYNELAKVYMESLKRFPEEKILEIINMADNNRKTPLYTAALYGNHEMVELLLTHGADPNLEMRPGKAPLLCAVNNAVNFELDDKNINILICLINSGADYKLLDKQQQNNLFRTILFAGESRLALSLMKDGVHLKGLGALDLSKIKNAMEKTIKDKVRMSDFMRKLQAYQNSDHNSGLIFNGFANDVVMVDSFRQDMKEESSASISLDDFFEFASSQATSAEEVADLIKNNQEILRQAEFPSRLSDFNRRDQPKKYQTILDVIAVEIYKCNAISQVIKAWCCSLGDQGKVPVASERHIIPQGDISISDEDSIDLFIKEHMQRDSKDEGSSVIPPLNQRIWQSELFPSSRRRRRSSSNVGAPEPKRQKTKKLANIGNVVDPFMANMGDVLTGEELAGSSVLFKP